MHWHSLPKEQVLQALHANAQTGLSAPEAQARLADGRNVLQGKKPKTVLQRFLSQFADFMILILLAAAAVSFVTARLSGENGFTDCAVILGIVVLNAVIGTVQETRAQKALDRLRLKLIHFAPEGLDRVLHIPSFPCLSLRFGV